MQLDILKRILTNTPKEQALALYNAMTGENATQEDLEKATKSKKKADILTIEKDLLNSYCEAVADLKRMRELYLKVDCSEMHDDLIIKIEEIIAKHTKRISDSDIWKTV